MLSHYFTCRQISTISCHQCQIIFTNYPKRWKMATWVVIIGAHIYRQQRSWGKVIFSEACVKNSVHRRGHLRGEVEGSGRGVSRPTPRREVGGSGWGVSRPTPRERGVSRPTPPRGGCIPACTEADTQPHQMATAVGGTHFTGIHSCYYKAVTNFVISGIRLKITIILALHLCVSDSMNAGESRQLGKFGFRSLHNFTFKSMLPWWGHPASIQTSLHIWSWLNVS